MTATTTAPTPIDLLPYIRAAWRNVGTRRTGRHDIARILCEHGAVSTAATLHIERLITATLPPAPAIYANLMERVGQMSRDSGIYLPSIAYMFQRDQYGAALAIDELHDAATAEYDQWSIEREQVIEQWWTDNRHAITALCLASADELLAAREVNS